MTAIAIGNPNDWGLPEWPAFRSQAGNGVSQVFSHLEKVSYDPTRPVTRKQGFLDTILLIT